jgi:hypothetical protein
MCRVVTASLKVAPWFLHSTTYHSVSKHHSRRNGREGRKRDSTHRQRGPPQPHGCFGRLRSRPRSDPGSPMQRVLFQPDQDSTSQPRGNVTSVLRPGPTVSKENTRGPQPYNFADTCADLLPFGPLGLGGVIVTLCGPGGGSGSSAVETGST